MKPHQQTTVFTLLGLRKRQRDIERITGIDRKTVRSYQRKYEAAQLNFPGMATDCPIKFLPLSLTFFHQAAMKRLAA